MGARKRRACASGDLANAYRRAWESGESSFTFQQGPRHVANYFPGVSLADAGKKEKKVEKHRYLYKEIENLLHKRHVFLALNQPKSWI